MMCRITSLGRAMKDIVKNESGNENGSEKESEKNNLFFKKQN